jgi:hypothetical protein
MQAVQAGMIANNTAAQEQPAAYNDFDCGTTVSKHFDPVHRIRKPSVVNCSSALLSATCAIVLYCRFRQCVRCALAQALEQGHGRTSW